MKPPLVYVAGKFSAPDRAGVELNIAAAVDMALEVARLGAMPVTPHANTAHPAFEEVQPYPFWIAGTMALLEACEAVMLVPGWETSSGARGEVKRAFELGLPVFQDLSLLVRWLEARA